MPSEAAEATVVVAAAVDSMAAVEVAEFAAAVASAAVGFAAADLAGAFGEDLEASEEVSGGSAGDSADLVVASVAALASVSVGAGPGITDTDTLTLTDILMLTDIPVTTDTIRMLIAGSKHTDPLLLFRRHPLLTAAQ
jgi:hypothetical protein